MDIPAPLPAPPDRMRALRRATQALEASFLSEMLRQTDLGKSPSLFGGGAGEDQYASFLVDAQATRLAEAGGIGLAEALFDALKETTNE